jgi:hypothetical protein
LLSLQQEDEAVIASEDEAKTDEEVVSEEADILGML